MDAPAAPLSIKRTHFPADQIQHKALFALVGNEQGTAIGIGLHMADKNILHIGFFRRVSGLVNFHQPWRHANYCINISKVNEQLCGEWAL